MGNPGWNCPLIQTPKSNVYDIAVLTRSVILSLSHQAKTNTRFTRACFPADVPNYAIFLAYDALHHLSTTSHPPGYGYPPSEDEAPHPPNP